MYLSEVDSVLTDLKFVQFRESQEDLYKEHKITCINSTWKHPDQERGPEA